MFCKNCGQQIPDTAKFCGKCGAVTTKEPNVNEMNNQNVNNQHINNQNVNNQYANNSNMNNQYTNNQYANNPNMNHQPINNPYANNFDAKKVMDEITHEVISLVKNPIATVRESKNKDNNSYMIFGLLACLVAILNVYILKSSIFNKFEDIIGYSADLLLKGSNFGLIIKLLINNVAVIGVVSGVIFLIVNIILKKANFTYFDGLKVVIAGYAYSTIAVFIGAIVSYIYLPLGMAIIYLSFMANMILIYEGLASFGYIDKNKCLYIVLIVMVAMMIFEYYAVTIIIEGLIENINNRMDRLMDSYLW